MRVTVRCRAHAVTSGHERVLGGGHVVKWHAGHLAEVREGGQELSAGHLRQKVTLGAQHARR